MSRIASEAGRRYRVRQAFGRLRTDTMGLINSDIPAPSIWPPPRGDDAVQAPLVYASRRDPIGHQVHIGLACFHLVCLPLATSLSAISFALLVGYALLRLPHTWRCYPALLRVATLWAILAWITWHGLSITWSEAPMQGLDELKAARVLLLPLALWPVLDRLRWLVLAALAGVLLQNGSQLLQFFHLIGDPAEFKGRYRGLLDGSTAPWCLAAICWHLSATLRGRGWVRWTSLAAMAVAFAGLIATGNRGPWIAAAIALPLAMIDIMIRRKETRFFATLLIAIGVVGLAATWPITGRMVVPRVQKAMNEVRDAREEGIYWTSGGLRIGLWHWAIDAWRQSPVIGIGAGGYRDAIVANPDFRHALERQRSESPDSEKLDRDHAHNTYLQALATTGGIGLTLLGVALLSVCRQVLGDPAEHLHGDGTLYALVGWAIAANFDLYTFNGHLYGLLMFMVAITLPHRPRADDQTL